MVFFPRPYHFSLVMIKTFNKCRSMNILQKIWPGVFKIVKAITSKESQKTYRSQEELKETWRLNIMCYSTYYPKTEKLYLLNANHSWISVSMIIVCQYWFINCISSLQFSSVAQSCPTLCDPMNHSTPGLLVHHQLQEFTQTRVHRISNAIQPSHPLSSPSPPAHNPSQHHKSFPMSQLFASGGQSIGVSA